MSESTRLANGVLVTDDDTEWMARFGEDLERDAMRRDDSWMRDNPDALGLPYTWAKDFPTVKPPRKKYPQYRTIISSAA